jgi:D-alanine transaminase
MCHIKAVTLLANVLDTQAAVDEGAHEAVLIRDNVVTEGTARSIYLAEGKTLYTHPLDGRILDSITRRIFNRLAPEAGYTIREQYVPSEMLKTADEIIAVGTTTEVAGVTHLDGQPVGNGKPGPIASDMFKRFRQWVAKECQL